MADIEFNEYIEEQTKDTDKLYYNYRGISRKEFPKSPIWKIINLYKMNKIGIKDINDPILDCLVDNFYRLKYLKEFRIAMGSKEDTSE